ncbi:helix-turn-helix transcriptional regulator [Nocardia farcinica]|uniref:Putative transcriptional regulator n=1 Tax=Nocardia farcinica (strain IFM 10152) TaxID=247156 RepID=Q5YUK9_NOCFA|nr:LuxR C-terminal-related transcriptional regulator [Nocardia farcinica]BAD58132.1 putative transcriptional regulator [Nocardia farcinica IFM 10152]
MTPSPFVHGWVRSADCTRIGDVPVLGFPLVPRAAADAEFEHFLGPGSARALLVCAPAGSGKTVLAAHHALSDDVTRPPVWVTVTAELNDADRWWHRLGDCFGFDPTGPAGEPAGATAAAEQLLAAVSAGPGPRVLVVDDAHLLTDPLVLAGLEHMIRHAPPFLKIVLCGRFEPPIRWQALELDGRVTRLGAGTLSFDTAQIAAVLAQHGCELTPEELAQVTDITRGWPALVRIVAIYLAAHAEDRDRAVRVLARAPHAVADFLCGELIAALPEQVRQFVSETSIPASYTPELAEHLAGPAAPSHIAYLERINFPFTSVDTERGRWISYHPMVRRYFATELQRVDAARLGELHRQLAGWYTVAGMYTQAFDHVLATGSDELLVDFLRAEGVAATLLGCGAAVLEMLDQAQPALSNDPFVWMLRVIDALERGDAAQAHAYLDLVRARGGDTESVAPPEWLRALLLGGQAHVRTVPPGDPGAVAIPEPLPTVGRADIDGYLAVHAGMLRVLHGDRVSGERDLLVGLALAEHAQQPRLVLHAVCRLAMAAGVAGELTTVRERARQAVELAVEFDADGTADAVLAATMAAFVDYLQARREPRELVSPPARRRRDGTTEPTAGWWAEIVTQLTVLDAAPDNHAAAARLRRGLLGLLDEVGAAATTGGLLPVAIWSLLHLREDTVVQLLVHRARVVLGPTCPEVALGAAALAHTAGKPAAVHELVVPLLGSDHPMIVVPALLLYATSSDRLGRTRTSAEALELALQQAVPDHLVRPFLDVPGAVPLLASHAGSFGHLDRFADEIRHHLAVRRHLTGHSLTGTELRVLKHLPTGRTTSQIAADLGVSVNTVKTHLRGIYGKLGIASRADALTEARQRGLL